MKFDVIVIGGGLAGMTVAKALLNEGRKVVVVSKGRSLHQVDYKDFTMGGGTLLMGDEVLSSDVEAGVVRSVTTQKLGIIKADYFVLATGKYFSGGIRTDIDSIYEPLFGCDVSSEERDGWFAERFSDDQPFMYFGVLTDDCGHPIVGCKSYINLYAAGEILSGISGADEHSDMQIISSALKVVKAIQEE